MNDNPLDSDQFGSESPSNRSYPVAFSLITSLFFMWGFLTAMNDILVPYFKEVFTLSYTQATLVQFCFFGAYFVGSVIYFIISASSGDPIARLGYKKGIMGGLGLSALGVAIFIPAAEWESYATFLLGLFVLGLGFTLLQISANPMAAVMGPEKTAASRLNLAQGFNSLGTTLAPLIGSAYILSRLGQVEEIQDLDAIKEPYIIFALVLVALAVLIGFWPLPRLTGSSEKIEGGAAAWKFPQLRFGMFAIFFYVGGEVAIGTFLVDFFGLPEIMGMDKETAGRMVAYYWGGAMAGRFLGAFSLSNNPLPTKAATMAAVVLAFCTVIYNIEGPLMAWLAGGFFCINLLAFLAGRGLPHTTVLIFAGAVIALLLMTVLGTGQLAMWSVIGIGLFNSIMWSNIFTLAIEGLGPHKSQGSSLLVMAIIGGAIFPSLQGILADAAGLQMSFLLPILSYLYIAWYGWQGYKPEIATAGDDDF